MSRLEALAGLLPLSEGALYPAVTFIDEVAVNNVKRSWPPDVIYTPIDVASALAGVLQESNRTS